MSQCKCDWCGAPATRITRRTLYANTEYENNSSYQECDNCFQTATDALVEQAEERMRKQGEEAK